MTELVTLAGLGAALEAGKTASRKLTRRCLDAIEDSKGEGPRAFVRVYAEEALRAAEAFDKQTGAKAGSEPLHGLPISIKDLFDVAGETTLAGSTLLAGAAPAACDATVVARLRAAGAVIVGRTNMTEFAFSGLGINPHYGTPRNPYDRIQGRIPGGSSSGAAISVADGMAAGAIGTDTGGSVRIPAALCGLTGFKPSASRVSMEGVFPLSPSLDSVGAIAPTVACCALLDAVLSGNAPTAPIDSGLAGVRIGVLQGYVLEGLEVHVTNCFQSALNILAKAGAKVEDVEFKSLARIAECNRQGGFAAAEAYTWHRALLERAGEQYDPRVLARILRGREISQDAYRELVQARRAIITEAERAFASYDVILSPTTPRIAPLIAELEQDDSAYVAANAAMLRNTSVFNFLDGCSLSIPCHLRGEAPVGLMVSALHGHDQQVVRIGDAIEDALARAGRAIHGRERPLSLRDASGVSH